MRRLHLPASKPLRILVIIGGLLVLCMCAFVGAVVVTALNGGGTRTPTPQVAEVRVAPKAEASATMGAVQIEPTKVPTATVAPSAAPVATATDSPSPTPAPTDTPEPSQTPEPTSTPGPTATPEPTATPLPTAGPVERLQAAAKSLRNANATLVADMAVVEYQPVTLTEGLFVRSFVVEFKLFAPDAFAAVPEMNLLTVRGRAEFTDKYGNSKMENAIGFTITRDVAEKINWQNILSENIGPLLADEKGCSVYVHPALQATWVDYVGR